MRLSGSGDSSIDDAIALVLHFHSGALGTIHSVWSADGQPGRYSLDLLGEQATITLDLGPAVHRINGVSKGRTIDAAFGDPMERSIARFLEAANGRRSLACPPDDAIRTCPWPWPAIAPWGRGAGLAVTVRRIAQSLPASNAADGVRLHPPEAAAAIVGRRVGPLIAVTYSVSRQAQLVACSPRSISSTTSPSLTGRYPSGSSSANAMPSGLWPSLSCAKTVAAVVPAADPMRQRLRQYIRPAPSEGDPVRVHLRPLGPHLAASDASSANSRPGAGTSTPGSARCPSR